MGSLDLDTRLEGADGHHQAKLSPEWRIWGPNGGSLAAIALRSVGMTTRFRRPASFACHFLSVGAFEPALVSVTSLRSAIGRCWKQTCGRSPTERVSNTTSLRCPTLDRLPQSRVARRRRARRVGRRAATVPAATAKRVPLERPLCSRRKRTRLCGGPAALVFAPVVMISRPLSWPMTALALLASLLVAMQAARAQETADPKAAESGDLRERLTEREDQNRLDEPMQFDLFGRPLTWSGQLEMTADYLDPATLGEGIESHDQLLIENEVETELFYRFGPALAIFAQLRFKMEWNNFNDQQPAIVTDFFVERGEMWIASTNIGGSGVSLELGRLHFEDERLWWWDEDLDALRVRYERSEVEIALSVARELAPARSDLGSVVPEDNRALRGIVEASWDFRPNHSLQFFALAQDDHSPEETIGEIVRNDDKDDSDANLGWLGLRAAGGWESKSRGVLGYWIDTAVVGGRERFLEYEQYSPEPPVVEEPAEATEDEAGAEDEATAPSESTPGAASEAAGANPSSASVVARSIDRSVHGWALDAGLTWILPVFADPRITVGYAIGSGDGSPLEGADRSFRQTGLHTNEPGFGGVRRFRHYGLLLDPELSNLSVLTIGVGCSLLESSSLDLVYHRYRLDEPALSLRSARIDTTLNGRDRDLGHAFDLVLALEEWNRVEVEVSGSVFQAGPAFGVDDHAWVWGGLLTFSVAF